MSIKKTHLKEDVEELLEKAVVEEATEAVWKIFEEVLSKMDEPKLSSLTEHFKGTSDIEISRQKGIAEPELKQMLKHSKNELIEQIRREKSTRQ